MFDTELFVAREHIFDGESLNDEIYLIQDGVASVQEEGHALKVKGANDVVGEAVTMYVYLVVVEAISMYVYLVVVESVSMYVHLVVVEYKLLSLLNYTVQYTVLRPSSHDHEISRPRTNTIITITTITTLTIATCHLPSGITIYQGGYFRGQGSTSRPPQPLQTWTRTSSQPRILRKS